MVDGYKIIKREINSKVLFECSYSDYELYQILESCGYKTTNKNKDILKKGLQEGKYYIEDELSEMLLKEFKEFLNNDPVILTEDILTEGKVLDKIRWKLAMFSFNFIKEKSLDDFFMAYYSDEKGNPTKEGWDFCKNHTRKEKIATIRTIANNKLSDEDKEKICRNVPAKEAEAAAVGAGGAAAVGGGAAIGSAIYRNITSVPISVGIASFSWNILWGGVILAGVGAAIGLRKLHKAAVYRREEIIAELRKK